MAARSDLMLSSAGRRNIDLDFLRGVAILCVVGFHLYVPATPNPFLTWFTTPLLLFGHRGVDLFFVLSGFLVGGLLLREYREGPVRQGRFLVRRMLKIWPAYYVFVLIQLISGHHPWNTFFFQHLFNLQNYFSTTLAQTWSLAIEEHFYLLLALFLGWAGQKRLSPARLLQVFSIVCVVALALRTMDALRGRMGQAHGQTQNRIDNLLFGVMLAVLFWLVPDVFDRITRRRWPLIAISLATLLLIIWLPSYPIWDITLGYTLIPLGLTMLLALTFRHAGALKNMLAYRICAWIGVYSYGIYLWFSVTREPMHRLILRFQTDQSAIWIAAILAQFAVAIALGFLMTRMVEVPFLRIRERLFPPSDLHGKMQKSAALVEVNDPAYPLDSDEGNITSSSQATVAV